MEDKNPINTTIIPPATDMSPTIKVEEFEDEFRMSAGYTFDAINAMVRRIEENLDEELMKRLAEQHGYIKPVRCRDCEYFKDEDGNCSLAMMATLLFSDWSTDQSSIERLCQVASEGFCAWAKPRENPCRNADESAAAFADAPTLETAREPMQSPMFELGA